MTEPLRIVILGLSITSAWGNGHATMYRTLVRALTRRGHQVIFLERDVPWYAENRDMPAPPDGRTYLYTSSRDLENRFGPTVYTADLVIVGSYVPDGVAIGNWVVNNCEGITAFYDIDTPVTLAKLIRGDYQYINPSLVARYDLYLSCTGGPLLDTLEERYGSPMACPLYFSVDPERYYPEPAGSLYDLGYVGTYREDRQLALEQLLIEPARRWPAGRFVVAGRQYPAAPGWPHNVDRLDDLPISEHRRFYNSQQFTLNLTRAEQARAGYSPSARLFEAAACGTPVISDCWEGLDTFFTPGQEILIAESPEHTLYYLQTTSEAERQAIGARARERVLAAHTADHRAAELEAYVMELRTRIPLKERFVFG